MMRAFNNVLIRHVYSALGLCLLISLPMALASGQSLRAYERAGDKAFVRGDYPAAKAYYQIVLDAAPKRIGALYRFAESCRITYDWASASEAYQKVAKDGGAAAFPLATFYRAECLKCMGDYDDAVKMYFDFYDQQKGKNFPKEIARTEAEIKGAVEVLPYLIDSADRYSIAQRLTDTAIITPFSDFGAHEINGIFYHSSRRFDPAKPTKKAPDAPPAGLLTRVLINGKPAENINLRTRHTANSCASADGKRLYFSRCEALGATPYPCGIFWAKNGNGTWNNGERLPQAVNKPGSSSSQPNVGFDSLDLVERLYFVSDRPGGFGGMDIWYCSLGADGLPLGEAQNAGPAVNTPSDEATPFFHTPTQTLFFSSEGHYGLGGYDIFRARRGQLNFPSAINLGQPFNSSAHDLYYVRNTDDTTGYFSSNRPLKKGFAKDVCCLDIFRYQLLPRPRVTLPPVAVDTPLVVAQSPPGRPDTPAITAVVPPVASPNDTPIGLRKLRELLPIKLYFANDEPDSNSMATATTRSYSQTFQAFYAQKENYQSGFSLGLAPPEKGRNREAVAAFFEETVRANAEQLGRFNALLLENLQSGARLTVSVRGFTSPRASGPYNIALAARRISSVRNELATWQNGALAPYLASGALRLRELPLGEAQSPAGISDRYDDPRNSVFSPAASGERRVEIEAVDE